MGLVDVTVRRSIYASQGAKRKGQIALGRLAYEKEAKELNCKCPVARLSVTTESTGEEAIARENDG